MSKASRIFKILGLRPHGGAVSHPVEVPDAKGSPLGIFGSEGCELRRTLSSEGAFFLSTKAKGSVMKRQVILKDGHSLRKLVSKLKPFPGFRTLAIATVKPALTPRQEGVVISALRMGYFDTPRRVRTRELAEVLGVSPATLTELLGRALRNLIVGHYSESAREGLR